MARKKVEEKVNIESILFKCRDILRQAPNSPEFPQHHTRTPVILRPRETQRAE